MIFVSVSHWKSCLYKMIAQYHIPLKGVNDIDRTNCKPSRPVGRHTTHHFAVYR